MAEGAEDQAAMAEGEEKAAKPLYATFRLGGQYDSNVGAWPWDDAFVAAQHLPTNQDDWAAVGNVAVDWQRQSESPFTLSAGYWLFADAYADNEEYNLTDQAVTLEPGFRRGRFSTTLPLSMTWSTLDNTTDSYGWTVQPTVSLDVSEKYTLQAWGAASQAGFAEPDSTLPQDDGDATFLGTGAGILHIFGGGFLRVTGDLRQAEADGDNWDRQSLLTTAVARVPVAGTLALILSAALEDVDYENPNSFFKERRKDEIHTLGTEISCRIRGPWEVWLQYTYTHADSNLPVYEYERHVVGAGVGVNL